MQQDENDNTTPLGEPYPVLIRGHSLRKTRALQSSTTQLNESFDAITLDGTTRSGSGSVRADPRQGPGRYWDTERARESSLLDEDFDLMTSSAGLTTERGSIYDSPPRRSQKSLGKARQQESTDFKRSPGAPDRTPQSSSSFMNPIVNPQTTSRSFQQLSPDRSKSHHSRQHSGPRFEVVKSKVVEDGPERTVTVSLWREQVTKPIGPNGETMSVHYYSAEDVLSDGYYHGEKDGSVMSETANEHNYRQRSPQLSTGQSEVNYYDNQPPPRASTPIRAQPITPTTTYTHHVSPRSPISQTSLDISSQTPDVSTSTVKSLPTLELEHILNSCEPSLIHVAPILACLGITREQHLKAIGRLSEETRDREVKEEALRLGMTVMEWAILLDKLHSL